MNPDSESDAGAHKNLRQRLKEATRDAILVSAEQVFGKDGLHAARMEDVAQSAGVSVGTLYNYFHDRAGLVDALLEERRAGLVKKLDGALSEVDERPFAEQLETVLHVLLAHFEAHRQFLSIVMQGEHAQDSSVFPASRRPRETMRAVYLRLAELSERGVQSGELRAKLSGSKAAGQMLGRDWRFIAQNASMLDHVGQFTDIARPDVSL